MGGMPFLTRGVTLFLCGAILACPSIAEAVDLAPHKAIYDIRLISAKNGSQVLDVRGKMMFMMRKSCDGWISDHRFDLNYNYSGSPSVQVNTKFASFERYDGKSLNFSSNRMSNGEFDQELRGKAEILADGKSKAAFTIPENLSFNLAQETLFPATHTMKLIDAAERGRKFFKATVFDGSDDEGPIEINAVIGKKIDPSAHSKLNKDLTAIPGWAVRLAVFPQVGEDQDIAEYEMSMDLLENGVVKAMTVDYHDFSVSQKLVAIEPLKEEKCGAN